MPSAIQEDWADFKDITEGNRREELKKFTKTGTIFGQRPNGRGKIGIPIKKIELPFITHGEENDGVGAGEGKPGDVIGKKPGKGKGDKPGKNPGEGMLVDVDMEEVWKEIQEELQLPNLQPKATPTFEDIEIRYNGVSKVGPRSLLHIRRTMKETMKREIAYNQGNVPKQLVPGSKVPIHVLHPIRDDFRYRQWNEIKKPSSNAAIFFVRDGSGSMGEEKCEIVSDIAFWIDAWIRRFYKETKKIYVWHDTEARELSEKDFYRLREGGGTNATSALKFVDKQLKFRVPPKTWNIYLFYFGDGETFGQDNKDFVKLIQNQLGPQNINLVGVTQILGNRYTDSLKQAVDKALESDKLNKKFVRTASVGEEKDTYSYGSPKMSEEERGAAVKQVLIKLLGSPAAQAAQSA